MSSQAQARLRIMKTLDAKAADDAQADLTLILDSSGAPSSRLRARFLSQAGDVMKIEVTTALGPGTVLSIAGEIQTETGSEPLLGQYQVCACLLAGIGKYHANLAPYVPETRKSEPPPPVRALSSDVNYYEVLQVSRNADVDTIHRVFHILAQRYHPDNRATGDDSMFRQVVEAHNVLSDPERRAAHDVMLVQEEKGRIKIFDSLESTQGVQAEIRKRQGILKLLYGKRMADSHQPSMRGRDFVELLGCPMEHLEFALWILREQKLLVRTDNNQFEITWQGVEAFESQEASYGKKQPLPLPAPAHAG